VTPEPNDPERWAGWGPPPSPRQYFEALVEHESELRESEWRAHDAKHVASETAQGGTDSRLNDVRLRFVPREVFESRMEALSRLTLGLLIMTIASLAGVVVTLATR
jgi:hypothetical protein